MNHLDINEIRKQAAFRRARERGYGLSFPDEIRGFEPGPQAERSKSATEVMRMLESMGKVPEPMGQSIGGNQPTPQQARPGMGVPMAPVDPQLPPLSDNGQIYASLSRITQGTEKQLQPDTAQQVWEELYNRDSARASGMRSIAEGLGNIRAITAGDILHKTHAAEPFIAEDLRARQGEIENRMSPNEAKALGLQYQPGMTRNMAEPLLRAKESESDRAIAEARLAFAVAHEGGVDRRFGVSSGLRKEAMDNVQGRYEDTQLYKVGHDFDAAVKGHRESLVAADKALAALDSGTSTGDVASIVQLARAAGEKGPLSNQDVAMYRYRMGVLNSIQDRFSQWGTGRISDGQRSELRQLLSEFRNQTKFAMDQAAERFVDRNNGRLGWDEDTVRGVLDAGQGPTTPQAPVAPAPQGTPQGAGRFVHVVNPDTGEEVEIDEADAEEAVRRGWRRTGT